MSAEAGKPYEWGGLGDSLELTPEKIDAIVSDPAAFVEEVERWTEPREDGPMTLTLTDFLLARIAEDEADAKAASPGGWQYPGIESVAGGTLYDESRRIVDVVYEQPKDHDGTIVRHLLVPEADANGRHIARHDPARVLAECEAKRAVVGLHPEMLGWCQGCAHESYPCRTLLALALPYADHPDYREEWRP